ncbi:MAG: MFS transporter [Chloroflexota bacterium]
MLAAATFVINVNATSLAPFLLQIADELAVGMLAAGILIAVSSVVWGTASAFSGALSDRFGRKPLLIGGLALLIVSPLGLASAQSYPAAVFWRVLSGVGGGTFMGSVFATVADRFPSERRGQALGWIVTGMSLSMVAGVPGVTFLGSLLGWRGAIASQAVAIAAALVLVIMVVPGGVLDGRSRRSSSVPLRQVLRPRVVALLLANTMERLCYAGVVVYLATFLIATYGLDYATLALILALVAIGNLAGNMVGGFLADHLPDRLLTAAGALVATGLLAWPLLGLEPGIWISAGIGVCYTFVNAIARPALLATLSDVSAEARGAVMGMTSTFASFGWLAASAVGGLLIASVGFGALGALASLVAFAGASLAVTCRVVRLDP